MKPMSLNLSKMKKIAGDQHSSTFQHPSGHKMVIAHQGVSAAQRKQLEKMPVHKYADGGDVAGGDIPYDKLIPQEVAQNAPYSMDPQSVPVPSEQVQDQVPTQQAAPVPNDGVPAQPPSMPEPAPVTADLGQAYQQGQQGISEQQAVDTAKAKSNVDIQQKELADRQALNQDFQKNQSDFMQHQQQFMKDYAADHIDPKHYLENMGTGQKIATGIGLLLGGFSTAFTHQGNPAMDFLNKQIERDIAAQEARKDQQKTLLGANQQMFKDNILSHNQTLMNMNDIYDHKIQLAAAQLGTPQAKAAADQAHAQFAMQNSELLNKNAMRMTALKAVQSGTGDPARLVPFLVPKEHQAKAFGEIQAAEDTRKMAGSILNSFDQAARDNTILRTGAGQLRTPPSVLALHQSMQPTFKDLEGTVRQAAMDNTFKNITPAPGDVDSTIKTKRKALEDYLQSKLSAPTARGYGIDLGKFQSTAPMQAGSSNPMEGKTASNAQGQRVVMKNGQWVPLGR